MQTYSDDGWLTALVMRCALAVMVGEQTVTVSSSQKPPKGFPRGELLSVGTNGARNIAVDPIKALAWVHDYRRRARLMEKGTQ